MWWKWIPKLRPRTAKEWSPNSLHLALWTTKEVWPHECSPGRLVHCLQVCDVGGARPFMALNTNSRTLNTTLKRFKSQWRCWRWDVLEQLKPKEEWVIKPSTNGVTIVNPWADDGMNSLFKTWDRKDLTHPHYWTDLLLKFKSLIKNNTQIPHSRSKLRRGWSKVRRTVGWIRAEKNVVSPALVQMEEVLRQPLFDREETVTERV